MNLYTLEIAEMFNLSDTDAEDVQEILDDEYTVDYSEVEQSELDFAYQQAYDHWLRVRGE